MTSNTARPRNVGPTDPNEMVEDPGQPKRDPGEAYKTETAVTGPAAKGQPGGKVNPDPVESDHGPAQGMDVGTPPDHPGVGKQGSTALPTE